MIKEIPICNIDKYKTRNCFNDAVSLVRENENCVLALYGLRRTGKTTLMKQLGEHFGIPYIYEVLPDSTMAEVYAKLDECFERKDRVVFLDEITNATDFVKNSALLADYYASCGMSVVIAGTDSLGIYLAEEDALLDRIKTINTTYISFSEHCEVLDTNDIDDYIRYGGLMNKAIAKEFLKTPISLKRYLDSSVSDNIAHSLGKADSSQYSEIAKYSEKDLSLIIRKVVELYDGRIEYTFLNNPDSNVSITAPIRDAIKKATDNQEKKIYKGLDRQSLISEYKDAVNLSCDLEKQATDKLIDELTAVLFSLDFMSIYESREYNRINGIWHTNMPQEEYYIIQPAIKYALLQEAKKILLNSPVLNDLTEGQRSWLANQIENNILGDMTESIVIFETIRSLNQDTYYVCKPTFRIENKPVGEYDMLIYDKTSDRYRGFEIKHTNTPYINQSKNLTNNDITELVNEKYGNRENVCVLYRGSSFTTADGIIYLNIADFLKAVNQYKDIVPVMEELTKTLPTKDLSIESEEQLLSTDSIQSKKRE